ncbi:hypothetical protein [Nonomuraea glycinis]|uniref:Uncharacterized protein n=1 Tax=Nonomuraea glycinis TaxID=2047744 RepID=A0A918A2I3_9ACTN|nr:hypothetical protein [Nonomuraea glycinis]GGP03321.1 hypothetical protein GCM10012278_14070 [Nonomuraea glycinis]
MLISPAPFSSRIALLIAASPAPMSRPQQVKPTVYAIDWTSDKMPLLLTGIARASAKLGVT